MHVADEHMVYYHGGYDNYTDWELNLIETMTIMQQYRCTLSIGLY